jgi:hypothetical protein
VTDVDGRQRRSPWSDVDRLLIDGNNLLHRTAGGPDPAAVRLLLARLRVALPASLKGILVLDGRPDRGAPDHWLVAPNLEVRHAGGRDADSVIVDLVRATPVLERANALVVTDDRGLTERVRTAGGRTRRLDWLVDLIERPPDPATTGRSTGLGQGRPPRPDARGRSDLDPTSEGQPDQEREWHPGRHATRKRGNPRRAPRPRR